MSVPVITHLSIYGGDSGFVNFEGSGPFTDVEKIQFSFDDTVAIPKAPAGDVIKITAIGTQGSQGGGDGYGYNASAWIDVSPFAFSFTPHADCIADSCQVTATVPADKISSVTMYGAGYFLVSPALNANDGFPRSVAGGFE